MRTFTLPRVLGILLFLICPSAHPLDLYVSTQGNDAWSGRVTSPNKAKGDGPMASLAGARDKIRELRKAGLQGEVRVLIRGGNYVLDQPFVLESQDSGTSRTQVIYSAYKKESPIFTGGTILSGWKKESNGRWTAQIPAGESQDPQSSPFYFRQLFINGERRIRARSPNSGFYEIAGRVAEKKTDPQNNRAFRFAAGDIRDWNDPDAEVIAIHSWEATRLHIASLDAATHTVNFSGPSPWPFTQWEDHQRYYVENVADALDAPGEWYLDRKSGVLAYSPLPGEKLEKESVVVPRLHEPFVIFKGDYAKGQFVENVAISGLKLYYADWTLPTEGYADHQAANTIPGAIEMEAARDCVIKRCEVAHIGNYAIRLKKGCRDNRIEENHLHDLGAGGICVGEQRIPKDEKEAVVRNAVFNNYIHDGGRVYEASVGVWVGQSGDNTISHNEISDLGYTGVSVGWTWGYGESVAQRNIIEDNHIHHIGRGVLSDMGGIYTLGNSSGSILRGNLIHDVTDFRYGAWGIYPDEGTTNLLIENNVVYRCRTGTFHQHYGKENLVRNNIFAFSPTEQLIRSRAEDHRSFRFDRNIIYFDQGNLLGGNWKSDHFYMDYNLYWKAGKDPKFDFQKSSFEQWRNDKDMDHHSIIADPLFKNPAKGDFRLDCRSPAQALGFQAIDMSKVGLAGPSAWRKLPGRSNRR